MEQQDLSVQTRQIQVNVNAVAGAPVIAKFRSSPESEIDAGQRARFQRRVDGSVSRVALVWDGAPLSDYAPVAGSYNDCPPGNGQNNGQKIYELQAWGPGGFVKSLRSLTVRAGNAPPTAQPQPPVISSFSANPPQLDATNTCVVLAVAGQRPGDRRDRLSRNGQQIAGPDAQSGYQDCVPANEEGTQQVYEWKVDTEFSGSTSQQLVFCSDTDNR